MMITVQCLQHQTILNDNYNFLKLTVTKEKKFPLFFYGKTFVRMTLNSLYETEFMNQDII